MERKVVELADALRRERSFEGAAEAVLRIVMSQAEVLLDPQHRIGWLSVAPPEGPEVVRVEAGPAVATRVSGGEPRIWGQMRRLGGAALCATGDGCAWALDGPAVDDETPTPDPWAERCRRLSQVLVLPVRAAADRPAGLLALGLRPQATRAAARVVAAELQPLLDLAAPALCSLPARTAAAGTVDHGPWLPVAGRTMAPIIATLSIYASIEEILLLRGPTGTGKSRLAYWCWSRSPRSGGRFVVANLLGVPESGQESELFGVRKGTYTGVGERMGQVQVAQHGTLFLDEIDKLSLSTQAKLLRLLDEKRYRILGDPGEKSADVRFIIASNVDLERATAEGRFLEDLFYRINVLAVNLPPLRERRDEIAPWASYLARTLHQGRTGRAEVELSAAAVQFLVEQRWPGNLRQLHNVVRRAYAFAVLDAAARAEGGQLEALVLHHVHVERALQQEPTVERQDPTEDASLEALRRTALGVVRLVERRRALGLPPLSDRDGDLELADAFRGLVLQIAADRHGDLKKAFALFGLEGRIKGGNHLRTWRQAEDQVAALRRILRAEAVEE